MNHWRVVAIALFVCLPAYLLAQNDNGIHVGQPKVYDSRELTLMLDNLSEQLQNKNFIDPKALAAALGNIQGYQNSDFSLSGFLNGAVGSQAASVFAGAGAGSTSPPASTASSGTPSVTVNVAPTLNAGTGTASTPTAASTTTPLGPQAPALPSLQTAPSYTPTFGSNGSDLLSDEVNLTYQLYNVRMLLDRSLTDRLHGDQARLQAVVGFDVDLEPDSSAKDAAAVVEVTVQMSSITAAGNACDAKGNVSLVALMPEEGSHNAATLSQQAYGFGGAIASSVFSLGIAGQKRSQVFYLYRDMDTVSFENPATGSTALKFGWQFRPVLGRKSVDPGLRHMIVVLGLPCSDSGPVIPQMAIHVGTRWQRYESKTQTTSAKGHWWEHSLPAPASVDFPSTEIPSTESSQDRLTPEIAQVRWVPTDGNNGVAIVTGRNLFPGTTVRLGGKTYRGLSDGLVIKSDQELEVTASAAAAVTGGVLSGRYGNAQPLEPHAAPLPTGGLRLAGFRLHPMGDEMYEVIADLVVTPDAAGNLSTLPQIEGSLNTPIVSVNGVPIATPPYLSQAPPPPNSPKGSLSPIELTTFALAAAFAKGAPLFTVTFPFAGPLWTASLPYYTPTLNVVRLGSDKQVRLLITATNAADQLCTDWVLQLDDGNEFSLLGSGATIPARGGLKCVDPHTQTLSFDIPAKDLKPYHRLLLVNRPAAGNFIAPPKSPLVGDIPKPEPPPPGPSLDKDQKVSVAQYDVRPVKFTGKHLDEVTKVLFDKIELRIVKQEEKDIVISLSPQVTSKARDDVGLQLLSDGNDPVIATLSVTGPKATNPPKKGK